MLLAKTDGRFFTIFLFIILWKSQIHENSTQGFNLRKWFSLPLNRKPSSLTQTVWAYLTSPPISYLMRDSLRLNHFISEPRLSGTTSLLKCKSQDSWKSRLLLCSVPEPTKTQNYGCLTGQTPKGICCRKVLQLGRSPANSTTSHDAHD